MLSIRLITGALVLALSAILTTCVKIDPARINGTVNFEKDTISVLEKYSESLARRAILQLKYFEGEPVIVQIKAQDNISNEYLYAVDHSLLFSSNSSVGAKAQQDVIIVDSVNSHFAISTPRGAIKRQFIMLKRLRKEWGPVEEFDYYMTFVFLRTTKQGETSLHTIGLGGIDMVVEYDIWEDRPGEYYRGWQDCDHTVLFSCDTEQEIENMRRKREETTPYDFYDVVPRKYKTKSVWKKAPKKTGKRKISKALRKIVSLPGYNPEFYRDLYLDFDFHPMVTVEEVEVSLMNEPEPPKKPIVHEPEAKKKKGIEEDAKNKAEGKQSKKRTKRSNYGDNELSNLLASANATSGMFYGVRAILVMSEEEEEDDYINQIEDDRVLVFQKGANGINLKGFLKQGSRGVWDYTPNTKKCEMRPRSLHSGNEAEEQQQSKEDSESQEENSKSKHITNGRDSQTDIKSENQVHSSRNETVDIIVSDIVEDKNKSSDTSTESDLQAFQEATKEFEDAMAELWADAAEMMETNEGTGTTEKDVFGVAGSSKIHGKAIDDNDAIVSQGDLQDDSIERSTVSGNTETSTVSGSTESIIDTTVKPPVISMDLEEVSKATVTIGGGLRMPIDGSENIQKPNLTLIGKNETKLELELGSVSSPRVGKYNLKMVSGNDTIKGFRDSPDSTLWDKVHFDNLEEEARNLIHIGVPPEWGRLTVLGMKASFFAQKFVKKTVDFEDIGGRVGTALLGTTLNGGVYRGMGFTGAGSIPSNNNVQFGMFYGGAGRSRQFFFPIGTLIKVQFKFNDGSLGGYFQVGVKRVRDHFYPDDEKEAIEFLNQKGLIYPSGFNHEKYRTGGIVAAYLGANKVKIESSKVEGIYDPSEPYWKNKVWIPKELKKPSVGGEFRVHSPLKISRLMGGTLPSGNSNVDTTTKTNIIFKTSLKKSGYPSWSDINWTEDTPEGILYNGGSADKQLYLPLRVKIRAEFRGNAVTSPILGFYVANDPGMPDEFYPENDEDRFASKKGKIIPVGFDSNSFKLGIDGVYKVGNLFECTTQKVITTVNSEHPDKAWIPTGAIGIMYKVQGKKVILPLGMGIKSHLKLDDGRLITGTWRVSEPEKEDQFITDDKLVASPKVWGTLMPLGLDKAKVNGWLRQGKLFKPEDSKEKVLYNPKDKYWNEDNIWTIDGTPAHVYKLEHTNKSFLIPEMTNLRAQYKTSTSSISGFFRCAGVSEPDWFYPDSETKAADLYKSEGALKLLHRNSPNIPATLDKDNRITLMNTKKTKGLYNMSDPGLTKRFWIPTGSLGMLYKGGGNGNHIFLNPRQMISAEFVVENSSIFGNFTPTGIGSPDMFHLDREEDTLADSFYGMSGRLIPEGFNAGNKLGIEGVLKKGNQFVTEKSLSVLNLNGGGSKVWIPDGDNTFESVGEEAGERLSFPSWKTIHWTEQDESGFKYGQVVYPKMALVQAQFKVNESVLSGLFYPNHPLDVFFPDNSSLAYKFYGLKGEILVDGMLAIKGILMKLNVFLPEVKVLSVTCRQQNNSLMPSGVLAMSFGGAGEGRRFVIPLGIHIRAEFKFGNSSYFGWFCPNEIGMEDEIFPDDKKAMEALYGAKVWIIPSGFETSGRMYAIKGTWKKGNLFKPDKQKTKVLYDPKNPVWRKKSWTPEGSQGTLYSIEGGKTIFLPVGIGIRMTMQTGLGALSGYLLHGPKDIFIPDDESKHLSYQSHGTMVPFGLNNTGIRGILKGSEFRHKTERMDALMTLNDLSSTFANVWKPHGILGMGYKCSADNDKLMFLPLDTKTKIAFKTEGQGKSITGKILPSEKVFIEDKFFPDDKEGSKQLDGMSGTIIPFFSRDPNVRVNVVLKENTFLPEKNKMVILYNPQDPGGILADGSIGTDKNEIIVELPNRQNNFDMNQDIPESYIGIHYQSSEEGKRIFFPNRALSRVQFQFGNRSVSGNFLPTEPGHPDAFFPDSEDSEINIIGNGLKGKIIPTQFHSTAIEGVLRESGLFQVDWPKTKSLYDPYNPLWSEITWVPKGALGTLFKTGGQDGQDIFIPVGMRVRAEFHVGEKSILGDFIANEDERWDSFYPDDVILAKTIYGKAGKVVLERLTLESGIAGVLKRLNVFDTQTEKNKILLDTTDPFWKDKVWIADDDVVEDTNQKVTLKDTRWTMENMLGLLYDARPKQIFLPMGVMVWSEYRISNNDTFFGFFFTRNVEEPDQFFPDNEDLGETLLGTTGIIVPVGFDDRKAGWGIKGSIKGGTINEGLNIKAEPSKTDFMLETNSSFRNSKIWTPEGSLGLFYGDAGHEKQFFLHLGALIRAEFVFGNASVPGSFLPVDPGRPDAFYADDQDLAMSYYGLTGKIVPSGFSSSGNRNRGIAAKLRPTNLVSPVDQKSKVVLNLQDPTWSGKVWMPEGTLGILYNQIKTGKFFFLRQGTKVRAEFQRGNLTLKGFFLANVPTEPDIFEVDPEDKEASLDLLDNLEEEEQAMGVMIFDSKNEVQVEGFLNGSNTFFPNKKIKAVYNPNENYWNDKVSTPEGKFGMLYAGAGNGKQFFFEPHEKIRVKFVSDKGSILGFFQVSGLRHTEPFYPDDETEAKRFYNLKGKIIPEGSDDNIEGIQGTLLEGNEFFVESPKVKAIYNPNDPAWIQLTCLRKQRDQISERPAATPEGKKIIYGYLLQGIEESPNVFIAEGDSLSGFFLPNDGSYLHVSDIPHGVLTPTHPPGHAIFVMDSDIELEFIKEIRGVFLIDALALTGGVSGVISVMNGTKGRYSFVLDKMATPYAYVAGCPEVNDIWSVYINSSDWWFDLPELENGNSHFAKKKRQTILVEEIRKRSETLGTNAFTQGVQYAGVRIKTSKSFAFIPFNFSVVGVLTIIPVEKRGEIISTLSEMSIQEETFPLSFLITNASNSNVVQNETLNVLFTPQNFPKADAITGTLTFNGVFGNLSVSGVVNHVWNNTQMIWTPVGFLEKLYAEDGTGEALENAAKNEWNKSSSIDLSKFIIPGVLMQPHEPPKKLQNFKFGPLFPRNFSQMEEESINDTNLVHEYVHGWYVKEVESEEPLFIPYTGIKGIFTPSGDSPLKSAIGYCFPWRNGKNKARFVSEAGASLSDGTFGKFFAFDLNGNLSIGFIHAFIRKKSTLLRFSEDTEVIEGWGLVNLPKINASSLKVESEYLEPVQTRVTYGVVDVGGGYQGIVVEDIIESLDDPNNPLFQIYLQHRAQTHGDVNPWGGVVIVDPIIRKEVSNSKNLKNTTIRKGYLRKGATRQGSMLQNIMKYFSLKDWNYVKLQKFKAKIRLEPLRLGNRVNVVNMLDFRMFLYSNYIFRKAKALDKIVWLYIPQQAARFLVVARNILPAIVKRMDRKMILPRNFTAYNFARYGILSYDELKLFEKRDVEEAVPWLDRGNNATIESATVPGDRDLIKLSPFQTAQVIGELKRGNNVVHGMDLGFQLLCQLGNDIGISEAARKFTELMKFKEEEQRIQYMMKGDVGRSIMEETSQAPFLETEMFETPNESREVIIVGWKTQFTHLRANETLIDAKRVFYGMGNCKENGGHDINERAFGGQYEALEYFLKVLRLHCKPEVRRTLVGLIKQGYLEYEEGPRTFKITRGIFSKMNVVKISHSDMQKLSVSFEFSLFTKTYNQRSRIVKSMAHVITEPYCVISRSVAFLSDLSFTMISKAHKVAPAHTTRLIRNLLASLRTILTKLHEDSLALQKCGKECEYDRTINHGDKFRIVCLIQFIINGLEPYDNGDKALKLAFREFVSLNLEALKERVDELNAFYENGKNNRQI